jgi:hypothetical protein
VPLDGIWLDDVWWYGDAPETAHRARDCLL